MTAVFRYFSIPESPLTYILGEEFGLVEFSVDVLGEMDVPVLVELIHILVAVVDLFRVVRHDLNYRITAFSYLNCVG